MGEYERLGKKKITIIYSYYEKSEQHAIQDSDLFACPASDADIML